MIKKITTFFSEVTQEFSKVSWPTREVLLGSTGVVIVLCLLCGLFIWGVDVMLSLLMKLFIPSSPST